MIIKNSYINVIKNKKKTVNKKIICQQSKITYIDSFISLLSFIYYYFTLSVHN